MIKSRACHSERSEESNALKALDNTDSSLTPQIILVYDRFR